MRDDSITGLVGCLVVASMWLFALLLLMPFTIWTDNTLDFWLTHFAGHSVDIPMILSFIITLVGNGVMLSLNIISEIAKHVMF